MQTEGGVASELAVGYPFSPQSMEVQRAIRRVRPGGRGLLKTMLNMNGNDRKTLTLQVSTQVLLLMK